MTGTTVAPGTATRLPGLAWRPVAMVAGAAGVLLLATSARYGYHRDELYFVVAGRHPAWGYDDQPPLLPLLARANDALFDGSLVALRFPSVLAIAATVLLTALITREMGGGRRAQLVAAGCFASMPLTLINGHLMSTSSLDLFFWALLCWLVARWVRTRDDRLWPLAGVLLGIAYLNKNLVAFLAVGLVAGVLIAGPREALRSRLLWAGALAAVLLALPNVWWQAAHGWPQNEMAAVIREDADDGGRLGFLPMQLLLAGPPLAPIWIGGLWRLFRNPRARPFRLFAWAWLVLAAAFLVTGGRHYYLAGLLPVLLASGAIAADHWLDRGRKLLRRWVLAGLIVVNATAATLLGLPVWPLDSYAGSVGAVLYDGKETVGWPRLAETVAGVYRTLPAGERDRATVLTRNYGEAGALDRYGPDLGLPTPHSGHNAYWRWGPPPETGGPVIVVGDFPEPYLRRHWSDVRLATRNDNGHDVDNEEQSAPVWVCRGQVRPWRELWPDLRRFG
jgi:4-amino-4-deoxy-L-arabinose transferase-like glycosyltransferase